MNNELFSLNFYEFFGCKSKEELHASVISNNKNTAVLNDFIAYYKNDIKSTAKYMQSPDDVIEYMQSLPKPKNDEISILCLDNKNAPIHIKTINAFKNNYQTVLKEMLLAKTVGYIPFYNRNINPQIIEELKTKTEGLFQQLDYIEFNNATHKAFSSLTHAEFSYKPIESNITKENSLEYYPFNEVESFIGTNEFEDYFNYYFAEKSLGLHVDHDEKALKEHLKLKTQFDAYEVVGCILYDDKNEVIESKDLFKGGVNRSVVDTKILFSYIASNSNVKGFSLYHNHPSGSINPSKEDGDITNTIKQIAKNLNIEFKDHYVVGKNGVYSFKDSFGVDSISPLENETIVEDAKGKYRLADEEKNKINSPSIVQQNAQMFLNSVKDKTAPFLGAESYGTNLVTIFPTAVKTMDAGRSFRGTNQLLMQIALNNMGSTDNAVISYEKAKEHGAGIVKGAKGINLTTYNTDTKKQTVYRYYPASSVYNGDRIPEHEQPKSNLTLRCSGSSVEEYLGVYLAATYSGAAFQATKDVVEAFRENLTKDLEASFNDNKHTRIFEIGNKASSVCQKTLDNIESQNTPKKKSDEMFMKSQHTPFNPVTGEVFVGSNEAKARRVMQVLKSTDPRFIDTADIKTLGLSLKTKAIIKEPELQINIEGKRRTFFNAIDIDGLPALAVNTASNKRENEVAL